MIRIALIFSLIARLAAAADVVPPKPVSVPDIAFPEGATSDRTVIDVEVKIVIDGKGEVTSVELVKGARGREKLVAVHGLSTAEVTRRVQALGPPDVDNAERRG